MAEEEPTTEKPVKKAKKAKLEAPPPEPKAEAERPTTHEIREAHKADLVKWCEDFGLSTEGKVEDLRKRLLQFVEAPEKAAKAAEEKKPQAPPKEEKKPAEKKEAKPKKAEKKPEKKGKAEEEAEEEYEPKLKPKLDARTRALLELRKLKTAQRPHFHRQEWFRYKKFGHEWRKPQGGQSKLRRHFGYRWNLPSIGYRGPRDVRGLHPSGFQEILVHNPKQLEGIDPERQAVRIAHGVGARKRELIEKACEKKNIRVLNRMVTA